ncbi:MAG: ABC transporter ATP-binding protein [Actinomycetaceae bacterium]|nr:ABC transporter ATP-binding protein [Actinomycetaceae bacterium]
MTNRGLSIDNLSVAYADNLVVDRVDLTCPPGTVTAIVGPSGSGKSSLLRACAGLITPRTGRILIDGVDATRMPPHRRGIGMMFQSGALFSHMNVEANIGYGLRGISRAQRRERVRQLLDLVGLSGCERRDVATLSGGQAQRVALARAIAPGGRALLLDEPLSALDRHLRGHLALEIRDIIVRRDIAGLYVTHDHDEAFAVADYLAVMADGRLLIHGTPADVWAQPGTREVAEFLGYGPFLDVLEAARWGFDESESAGRLLAIGPRAVTVGQGARSGRVCAVRDLKGSRRLDIEVEDASYRLRADVPPLTAIAADDRVDLALDGSSCAWVSP